MLEETETEETRGFFVDFKRLFCRTFVIGYVSLGSGRRDLWLRLCAGQFVLEIRKLLATSEAEFN